jgi:hypothetical protein
VAYGLPTGLSIDPDTGVITGTASAGTYEAVTVATDTITGRKIFTEIVIYVTGTET